MSRSSRLVGVVLNGRLAKAVNFCGILSIVSCTPLDAGDDYFGNLGGSAGSDAAGSGGSPGASAGSAGTSNSAGATGCPPIDAREVVNVPERAGEDVELATTNWSCEHDYVLQGRVFVPDGAKLTISEGVRVRAEPSALLLVQRGGELHATGTREAPIVFTSAQALGQRSPADWRGLVLIGNSVSHATNLPVYNTTDDHRAFYGGGPQANPNSSCGTLRYVRVEFAGGNLDEDAFPGSALTLAGCGAGTTVDHVQVHRATDGIGLYGGMAPLEHVLVTHNTRGNAIEWTAGYGGFMQFIIAQSLGAGAGLAGSNSAEQPERQPISAPRIFNATLVGSAPLVGGAHYGVLLRYGSHAIVKNSIVQGFTDAAFDLRYSAEFLNEQVGPDKAVDISHVLLFGNPTPYTASAQRLDDGATMRERDPELTLATSRDQPAFQPKSDQVDIQIAPVPPPLDATASYRGAVSRTAQDWTVGWTAFPAN